MYKDKSVLTRCAVQSKLTIPSLFLYATGKFSNPSAFMVRGEDGFESVSTEEFRRMVIELSLGLQVHGLRKGDRVALVSDNRIEWAASDLAISCAGGVTVPISPLLTPTQTAHILRDADVGHAVVSSKELAEKIMDCKRQITSDFPIFVMEGDPPVAGTISLEELVLFGIELPQRGEEKFVENALSVDKNDLSTIMYTSGTSGLPKGVRLSHKNITSNVIAMTEALKVDESDRCLSFLPLSHAFERTAGFLAIFYSGATIAYAESVDTVARDLEEVKPTILVSVPRLYERMEQSIREKAETLGWLKRSIFGWAITLAKRSGRILSTCDELPFYLRWLRSIADILVYRKIRAKTGGRVRLFISGGAPLDTDIAEFFLGCGMLLLEGYGLTEASPTCAVNRPGSFRFGSVGLPLPGVKIALADDGEVLVRGENIMLGYQNMEEETQKVLVDGWLHTGDLGTIDSEGFLYLRGRKKELIITSWGVNVAPAWIEQRIKRSPYIKDVVLVGNGFPFIAALVVPDVEKIANHLGMEFEEGTDPGLVIEAEKTVDLIRKEIDRASSHLSPKERVKNCMLLSREFSVDRGELTVTMKPVRSVISAHFRKEIEEIYRRESAGGQ
ncbi:MAG: AMP-dependent synthetase/ligase [Candidatus Glassbacteria bacterium]